MVLVFAGHDPSGAAGVQADIESISANGGRVVSVITALTAQNTLTFAELLPQRPGQFRHQLNLLLDDIAVDACKIGLCGSLDIIKIIAETVEKLKPLPVVLDPILASGSGAQLVDENIVKGVIDYLLPQTTLLTPNWHEARTLTGTTTKNSAAEKLFEYGCGNLLITGGDSDTQKVINTLYRPGQTPVNFEWERLPHTYHGSGCTLSAAITAHLARREEIASAVKQAQAYTWQTLKNGRQLGGAQWHPDRFYK